MTKKTHLTYIFTTQFIFKTALTILAGLKIFSEGNCNQKEKKNHDTYFFFFILFNIWTSTH